jgi:hypothetical protein
MSGAETAAAHDIPEPHGDELRGRSAGRAMTMSSAMRLVAPMTLVGRTALSVEMRTNMPVWKVLAADATFKGAENVRPERFIRVRFEHRDIFEAAAWYTSCGRTC